MFRERIIEGRICYEADVNQLRDKDEVNWEKNIQNGFGFLVDTNDEYDVKKLLENDKSPHSEKWIKRFSAYKEDKNDKNDFAVVFLSSNSKTKGIRYDVLYIMFHLDRVAFLGEGNYGVRDVKQVKVTESYLGLGPNCQTGQNKADCIIWRHLERILATCHCAPFSLKSYFGTQVRGRGRERGREGERERERER